MTEKRFVFREDYDWWEIKDTTGQIKGDYDEWFSCERVVDLLNTVSDENEQLKCENKNLEAILDDFMNICNRLQSNPSDKQTLNVTRDMLQNMGVDLE